MHEQETHCSRCDEVISAPVRDGVETVCSTCARDELVQMSRELNKSEKNLVLTCDACGSKRASVHINDRKFCRDCFAA